MHVVVVVVVAVVVVVVQGRFLQMPIFIPIKREIHFLERPHDTSVKKNGLYKRQTIIENKKNYKNRNIDPTKMHHLWIVLLKKITCMIFHFQY